MKRAAVSRVYIPGFYGNQGLPESDQVTVEMSIATLKEKEKFSKVVFKKGGKTEMSNNEYSALRSKVKGINNYFDDNDNPIDTADKLIADMESGSPESTKLCAELWNHIMGYDVDVSAFGESDSEELTEGEE